MRVTLLALALCCATGLGWWGSGFVRSPSQVVADATPPPPADLTAAVRHGRLRTHVVARGEVSLGPTHELALPATGVLTSLDVRRGVRVVAGQRIASVDDRPVLVLPGRIPLWRDLVEGDTGEDVGRLQLALGSAGFAVLDAPGSYGPSTASAIEHVYTAVGSTPATAATAEEADGTSPPPPGGPGVSAREAQSVPRDEILMVPQLPARVARVDARLGGVDVERSVLLAFAAPQIRATVTVGDAEQVEKGAPVRIQPEGDSVTWRGRVVTITEPALDEEEGYVARAVIGTLRQLPLSAEGRQVQVTITGSEAEQSLIVPVTAVWQQADGGTHLVVVDAGRHRRVLVRVLRESNGSVAVVPAPAADGSEALRAGDRVLIGVR